MACGVWGGGGERKSTFAVIRLEEEVITEGRAEVDERNVVSAAGERHEELLEHARLEFSLEPLVLLAALVHAPQAFEALPVRVARRREREHNVAAVAPTLGRRIIFISILSLRSARPRRVLAAGGERNGVCGNEGE